MGIDRKALVFRHHPIIRQIEPLSPMSLGNGSFGFSADVTGLQSFQEAYEIPLGTQSHWGWHSTGGRNKYQLGDNRLQNLDTYGRPVPYPLWPEDREEEHHWLRQNPHRLQLGNIGFKFFKSDGSVVQAEELEEIEQQLNLWEGILYSRYRIEGELVEVETCVASSSDQIGVKIKSSLVAQGRIHLFVRFPGPDMIHRAWDKSIFPDWDNDDRHQSTVLLQSDNQCWVERSMDDDRYEVRWSWTAGTVKQAGVHEFVLEPSADAGETFECSFHFAENKASEPASVESIQADSKTYWEQFWLRGGAVTFEGSTDPRWHELERRAVLSQYLTAIHSSGPIPPQETGLMYNSWFGKPHLEMHWWHAAHFPMWGRESYLERGLEWYNKILPKAIELAESQGYKGARWPKMTDYDGNQSPSAVAAVLIWQQPHPIALAEYLYLANPSRQILEKFKEIVYQSADFMADYAVWREDRKAYVLGPPLIPAQECHKPMDSMNPPYELEYWRYGLETAAAWAERLGETPNPKWKEVADHLDELPQKDGVYLAHANCPDTFERYNRDHPSMLGAMGMLPGKLVDPEVMRATVYKVKDVWQWPTSWGWDFPMAAMTAARLGERALAVDYLLMDAQKNTYLPNGHNYQREGLYAYLPGNGGLLIAVAMMACGWQGHEGEHAPGFPDDGSWKVQWEGLRPLL